MLRGILMGVLERIESIIKANLSDLLEKPGDPEKLLERLISEMELELANARAQIAAAIREGKRLNLLCIEGEQSAEKWHKKAVLAVQHDKDNLAKEALLRKRVASASAADYRRECNLNEEVIVSLKSALKALKVKIQEAKRKKNELVVRKRQIEVDRLLGRDSLAAKRATLERMEDKVISLSVEVEVMEEFSGDKLAVRLREEELEAELAKLKDRMKSEKS